MAVPKADGDGGTAGGRAGDKVLVVVPLDAVRGHDVKPERAGTLDLEADHLAGLKTGAVLCTAVVKPST